MPRRANWADAQATHGSNRRSGGGASPPADVPCADRKCVRALGSSCRSFAVVRCTRSARWPLFGGSVPEGSPFRRARAGSGEGAAARENTARCRACSVDGRPGGMATPARNALHRAPRARAAIQESWSGELFATRIAVALARAPPIEAAQRRPGDAGHDRPGRGHPRAAGERGQHTCVQPARASLAAGQHQARRSGCSAGLRARTPWARSTSRVQQLTEVGTAGRAGAVPISFTAPARWLTEGQPGSITCLARASGPVEQPAGRVACGVQPGRIRGHRPGCPHAVRRGPRDQHWSAGAWPPCDQHCGAMAKLPRLAADASEALEVGWSPRNPGGHGERSCRVER